MVVDRISFGIPNCHWTRHGYDLDISKMKRYFFLPGLSIWLNNVFDVDMPLSQYWHCILVNYIMLTSALCSTYFIISMTFERFYSIIRPHKAASVNTVKKAKRIIACIVVICLLYNSPHIYLGNNHGIRCVTYNKSVPYVQVYYWFSFGLNFEIPFISLLAMNIVIIHTLSRRSQSNLTRSEFQAQAQGQGQDKSSKMKGSDSQIYVMLLAVTFAFLILVTPFHLIANMDKRKSPKLYAIYYFLYHFGVKLYYTNNGINFFLYVISGKKFRSDLVRLFRCNKSRLNESNLLTWSSSLTTSSTTS